MNLSNLPFFLLEPARMKMHLRIILSFFAVFSQTLLGHPSFEDRPIRFYYHCGKNAITAMDKEGRGGFAALIYHVQREKQEFEKKMGRVYFLFPFLSPNDPHLKNFPYDGFEEKKGNLFQLGHVKIGLGEAKKTDWVQLPWDDLDALVYFDLGETKLPPAKLPEHKTNTLPVFLITEAKHGARFQFFGNVHHIHCPMDFGKIGVLDLTFRKRDLIAIHESIVSINLTDRNRSWIPYDTSVTESSLPAKSENMTDKVQPTRKSNIQFGGLGNSYDREISGTEKSFGKD